MADLKKHILVGVTCAGSDVSEIDPGSVKVSPELNQLIEKSGAIHPQIAINVSAEPTIEFTTTNIKLISELSAISAETPVKIFFRALADGCGFGTGYVSLAVTAGIVEPVSISASPKAAASLTVRVHPASSDGDADPVTVGTTSVSLAAPANYYVIGATTIDSAIDGVTKFDLDWGYKLKKDTGENGKPYPINIWADEQDGKITVTAEDISEATQAVLFKGKNSTSISQAFRKLSSAALPVDIGGYTITASKANVTIPTVSGGRPSTVEITANLLGADFAGTNYLQFASITE